MKLLLASGGLTTEDRRAAFSSELRSFLDGASILFIPYALRGHDGYVAKVRERGQASGIELRSIHRARDPRRSVARADAILVGGGNTFRLLAELHRKKLLGPIRRRAAAGMPYAGISAGTNVACLPSVPLEQALDLVLRDACVEAEIVDRVLRVAGSHAEPTTAGVR